jgi:hypothetical protein
MNIHYSLLAMVWFLSTQALHAQVLDWATKTADGSSVPYGMAVDAQGNSYITGAFQGTTDFDPGPGGVILTSAGMEDAFVAKLDPAGTVLWAFRFGDLYIDYGQAVAVDAAGDLYVAGRFQDTMDVDPGPGVYPLISPGSGTSGFVAKYTPVGNLLWAMAFQAEYAAVARALTLEDGRLYVAGTYSDTTNFNGVIYAGNLLVDAYVAKVDTANGSVIWVRGAGSFLGNESGRSVAVDAAANVYYAGKFRYTVDFDPGPGTASHTSSAGFDAYVSKLDSNGNFIWVRVFEGLGGDDEVAGIHLDAVGDLYLGGNFVGTIDADPDTGMTTLTAVGGQDVFVMKMDSAGNLIWANSFGGTQADECLSMDLDDSAHVYTIGSFQSAVDFDPSASTHSLTSSGVKDVFLHALDSSGGFRTVWQLGSSFHEYGADVHYLAPGKLYSMGHFLQTLDMDPGVAVYNLTPNGGNAIYVERMLFCSHTAATFSETFCDSFISPSGNYVWTGSGTYQDTIPNQAGCDSAITIHLTIVTVDSGVTQNGIVLTANAANATYQWIDCDNGNNPIAGATQQSFTPSVTGTYAVVIMENGCSDTSACFPVTVVGVADGFHDSAVKIFPNPAGSQLILEMQDFMEINRYQIYDPAGRLLLRGKVEANSVPIDIGRLAAGMYILEAGECRLRFVKQ